MADYWEQRGRAAEALVDAQTELIAWYENNCERDKLDSDAVPDDLQDIEFSLEIAQHDWRARKD